VVGVSHHLAHLYSAFHPSPFDSAAIMVVDAQGGRVRDATDRSRAPRTPRIKVG
jgi:carbamoyltransferase